ncbi:MAG: glycosyl hydrolase family 18 protein [Bacteroidales bacterium]|nr:glycosyl hydrolase family 18 protein [Bacteroidales bacterium]
MKSIFTLFLIVLFLNTGTYSQTVTNFSVHKNQKEYFDSLAIYSPNELFKFKTPNKISEVNKSKNCTIEKIVFGWHPYWSNGLETNYQWNLLSDLSYFSYEIDYLTGDPVTTNNWETATVIDDAQTNGVRVNLCITLFDNHQAFFENATAQQNLIDNLLTLVQNRNANGINVDFELVPGSQAVNFNNFLVNLATQFHTENPDYQISIALHAVDWNDIYDIPLLKDYIDLFIIMAYDYYWPGSSLAGPSGQLYMMNTFNRTISRSIIDYLYAGVPREKLVCGLPYYGYEWQTTSDNVPTSTTNSGTARTIKTIKNNSNGYYSDKQLDANSMCAYYNYYTGGTWHQAWVDDENSLKYKYDVVKQQDIAGIGIWALGYDDGYSEMWNLIQNYFSNCAVIPSTYNFYDMGGPTREHYNREDYIFTIAPTDYTDYLALNFTTFELEANYDSLWIYDGANINAPLIGRYSGTTSPGIVEASGGAITIKFYSDGATVYSGWNAEWRCSPVDIDKLNKYEINVFPNPTNDYIQISEQAEKIELFSLNGILILSSTENNKINVSNLSSGIYILKIKIEDNIIFRKVVIQH